MKYHCIISIGQLREDTFAVNFYLNNVFLQKLRHVLISYRDSIACLCLINSYDPQPLPSVANHFAPAISTPFTIISNMCTYSMHEIITKQYLVLYLHQAACIPFPLTWMKSIDAGFYATWPGLTSALVCKHLPKSIYTAKGNIRQEQKNLRSTKQQPYIYNDGARRT